jgi:hypothetical protein
MLDSYVVTQFAALVLQVFDLEEIRSKVLQEKCHGYLFSMQVSNIHRADICHISVDGKYFICLKVGEPLLIVWDPNSNRRIFVTFHRTRSPNPAYNICGRSNEFNNHP